MTLITDQETSRRWPWSDHHDLWTVRRWPWSFALLEFSGSLLSVPKDPSPPPPTSGTLHNRVRRIGPGFYHEGIRSRLFTFIHQVDGGGGIVYLGEGLALHSFTNRTLVILFIHLCHVCFNSLLPLYLEFVHLTVITVSTLNILYVWELACSLAFAPEREVTKRCRLSWGIRIWAQMRGEGVSCGASTNGYSCTQKPK
jgi:hypothetical protein